MKPPIPTPEPSPVQTLRRYGLNATADDVAEVYRQNEGLTVALNDVNRIAWEDRDSGTCGTALREIARLTDKFTTATQKKG